MKKKMLKKTKVLREGYVKGLKQAQRIINEQIKGYVLNENPVIPRFSVADEHKKEKEEEARRKEEEARRKEAERIEKAKKEVLEWYNTYKYFDEIYEVIGNYRENYWTVIKDVLLNYDKYDIYIIKNDKGCIRLCVKDKGRNMRLHWIELHDKKDKEITIDSCSVLMCDFFPKYDKAKMYEKMMNVIETHNGADKIFSFSKEELYRMVDKPFTDIDDDFGLFIDRYFTSKETNESIRYLIKKIWEAQGQKCWES